MKSRLFPRQSQFGTFAGETLVKMSNGGSFVINHEGEDLLELSTLYLNLHRLYVKRQPPRDED